MDQMRVSCAVRFGHLVVAGHRKGKLCYFNRFPFRTAADAAYFVLLAYAQSELAADQVPLYLCGDVVEQGGIYRELRRYVADIRFSTHPRPPALPPELEELPVHQYYDLLCLS
jgi:hypothetical protein